MISFSHITIDFIAVIFLDFLFTFHKHFFLFDYPKEAHRFIEKIKQLQIWTGLPYPSKPNLETRLRSKQCSLKQFGFLH